MNEETIKAIATLTVKINNIERVIFDEIKPKLETLQQEQAKCYKWSTYTIYLLIALYISSIGAMLL